MKKVVLTVTVLAISAAVAAFFLLGGNDKDVKVLKTVKVSRGDIRRLITATGRLNPINSVEVGSQVSGTVKRIYVDYNSIVKRGQVIAQIDPDLFEAQSLQARANLDASVARLKQARANLEREKAVVESEISQALAALREKESDFKRISELFEKGMVSEQEIVRTREAHQVALAQQESAMAGRTQVDVREADVAAAEASVSQMKASLKLAETNLAYTTIRSPIDGIVIARSVNEGQTVAASLSAPTLLMIGDLGKMEVKVSVDEADIGQVKAGQGAFFTVDSFPGRLFEGKVSKIYLAPVIEQNVVTYEVVVEIDNSERLLMPGMTANVDIVTNEKKGVLVIPNGALRVRMEDRLAGSVKPHKGMKRVWTPAKDDYLPKDIVTGISDSENTEVISGLAEGDEVVVEGSSAATKQKRGGSPLRIAH